MRECVIEYVFLCVGNYDNLSPTALLTLSSFPFTLNLSCYVCFWGLYPVAVTLTRMLTSTFNLALTFGLTLSLTLALPLAAGGLLRARGDVLANSNPYTNPDPNPNPDPKSNLHRNVKRYINQTPNAKPSFLRPDLIVAPDSSCRRASASAGRRVRHL